MNAVIHRCSLLACLGVASWMCTTGYSQEPNKETNVAPDVILPDQSSPKERLPQVTIPGATATDNLKSIGGMIVSGGSLNVAFFGILGLFSLWAATIVLERTVHLRRERILPREFEAQIAKLIESHPAGLEQMRAACQGKPVPGRRVLHAGVIRAGRPMSEVEKGMEDAIARETALLRGKYRPLNVIGNISPLVGLLGTVVGMIMAFQISSQEGLGKAEQLAEGIYLALMTTAAGLTIAIPCLLFASWFQARGERFMGEVADTLTEVLPSFARLETSLVPQRDKLVASGLEVAADLAEQGKRGPVIENDASSVRERFLRDGVFNPVQG
jgi:biopolymer transport protein ExbB